MRSVRTSFLFLFLLILCSPVMAGGTSSSPDVRPAEEGWRIFGKTGGILVIETIDSVVDSILTLQGIPFDYYYGTGWDTLNLVDYQQVFLAMDGGLVLEPAVQHAADFVSQGGRLHGIGGSSYAPFVEAVDLYLMAVDEINYNWTIPGGSPDLQIVDGSHYLCDGLADYDFISDQASYYSLRIEEPQLEIGAINGDGFPLLVSRPLGLGWLDWCINSPNFPYYNDAGDWDALTRIVLNMLAGPSNSRTVAVLGNQRAVVVAALTDLGYGTVEYAQPDYTLVDLSAFSHVFNSMDGGAPSDASIQHLADFATAGGNLNQVGGSGSQAFTTSVNDHLIQVDVVNYTWALNIAPPDENVVIPPGPLALGLPLIYDFVNNAATFYQLKVIDPAATIHSFNGDGFPTLSSKDLGAGNVNLLVHSPSPGYYADLDDYFWFRMVIANMMGHGSPANLFVEDVPNDQGGQARLSWDSSGYDAWGSPIRITWYAIWRRSDGGVPKAYPPGNWDFVSRVPARGELKYQTVVPTLCDSTDAGICPSDFFVSAQTTDQLVYFDSAVGSGYSVDNLAPSAPKNLVLFAGVLSWDEAEEEDFQYFTVYGSNSPVFGPGSVVLGHTPVPDLNVLGTGFEYLMVTATDFAGNQSPASMLFRPSNVPGAPGRTAVYPSVPNPFNPRTVIRFDLAKPEQVSLVIFDLNGRRVRTLVEGEKLGATSHQRTWKGNDDSGRQVAAGVYFYMLKAGDFTGTGRMVLVR